MGGGGGVGVDGFRQGNLKDILACTAPRDHIAKDNMRIFQLCKKPLNKGGERFWMQPVRTVCHSETSDISQQAQ